MHKFFSFTLLFFLLFSSQSAFAACTSPPGAASQTRYDFGLNKLYYCNDTDWIESGGGGGVIPTNIFSGTVSSTTTTVAGITYPAYYVIAASALGYPDGGGNSITCVFKIKVNGGWVDIVGQNNTITPNYFVANIIQVSATESFVQGSISADKKYGGTWNGQMTHGTSASCPSVATSVVRLN